MLASCCFDKFRSSQNWSRLLAIRTLATEANVPLPRSPPVTPRSNLASSATNQLHPTVSPEVQAELQGILSDFRAPIRYAAAYGSGVLKQAGYSSKDKPMLDFLFGVTHPSHWHDLNMQDHRDHYAYLARLLGSSIVSWIGVNTGAGLWFNVECVVNGRTIKYGIISIDALTSDLYNWDSLYAAGRLHKPVKILRDDARVRLACQVNLTSALRTSLLLLPEQFTERQLYETITALSYKGDVRMKYAENPEKVRNIVQGQYDLFKKLYAPMIRDLPGLHGEGDKMSKDDSVEAKRELVRKLPSALKERIRRHYSSRWSGLGLEEKEFWHKAVQESDFGSTLQDGLQNIVAVPAFRQSLKGVISVGPTKGVRYVWPKVQKRFSR